MQSRQRTRALRTAGIPAGIAEVEPRAKPQRRNGGGGVRNAAPVQIISIQRQVILAD